MFSRKYIEKMIAKLRGGDEKDDNKGDNMNDNKGQLWMMFCLLLGSLVRVITTGMPRAPIQFVCSCNAFSCGVTHYIHI